MKKTCRINLSMEMEIDRDFFDDTKKWEHHIEYLVDCDSHPEIKSIYGVQVEKVKD